MSHLINELLSGFPTVARLWLRDSGSTYLLPFTYFTGLKGGH